LEIGDEVGLERTLGYIGEVCVDNGDCPYFSCQEDAHGRRVRDMTIREIGNELEKIYKERKSWSGAKGPFTELAIRLKELILIKQQLLYRIEDAKFLEDKCEESFNLILYKAISDYLKELEKR